MTELLSIVFQAFHKRDGNGVLLRASIAFAVLAAAIWGAFLFLNRDVLGATLGWFFDVIRFVSEAGDAMRLEEMPVPPTGAGSMLGGFFLVLLTHNIVLAAYEAACLRWLIHGADGGAFGLSLGFDTWRVWGVYWVWFGLKIALAVATAVIIGLTALVRGEGWSEDERELIGLATQIGSIVFLVRWAPAAATSIGRGAFSFFDAWTVTSGRFWRLLAAFATLAVIVVLYHALVFGGVLYLLWPSLGENVMTALANPQDLDAALDLVGDLFSASNLPFIVGGYLALTPALLFMLLAYYGICARTVRIALDEGKIEREI